MLSDLNFELHFQSAKNIPTVRDSRVEFQPQWVMNAPVAGWFKIFICGTRPLTIIPLLFVSIFSLKLVGVQLSCSFSWGSSPFFITQRNDEFKASRAKAISVSWASENLPILLKQMYTIEFGSWESSQLRQLCWSWTDVFLELLASSLFEKWNKGPIYHGFLPLISL